jgi:hypothetical protein
VTRRLIVLLVLAALLLTGATGCKAKSIQSNETDAPNGTSVSTATLDASATAETTDGTGSGTSGTAAAEAEAIQKELSAIQKELDGMSMPGDSDFDSIEDEL